MEFANRAETEQSNLCPGELFFYICPLLFAQIRLDAMFVSRAQFDGFESGRLAILDDRRNVPVFGKIVGHKTQPESAATQRRIIDLIGRDRDCRTCFSYSQ